MLLRRLRLLLRWLLLLLLWTVPLARLEVSLLFAIVNEPLGGLFIIKDFDALSEFEALGKYIGRAKPVPVFAFSESVMIWFVLVKRAPIIIVWALGTLTLVAPVAVAFIVLAVVVIPSIVIITIAATVVLFSIVVISLATTVVLFLIVSTLFMGILVRAIVLRPHISSS